MSEKREFLSLAISLTPAQFGHYGPEKRRETKKMETAIKKMNGMGTWLMASLYTFVYVMSYVALLWNFHFHSLFSTISSFCSSLTFTRIYSTRVIWWPIYCFLSEFVRSAALKHFGEVLFDIRYDRFVFVPSSNSFTQLSRTHMLIQEFCIWLGLFWDHFEVMLQENCI